MGWNREGGLRDLIKVKIEHRPFRVNDSNSLEMFRIFSLRIDLYALFFFFFLLEITNSLQGRELGFLSYDPIAEKKINP